MVLLLWNRRCWLKHHYAACDYTLILLNTFLSQFSFYDLQALHKFRPISRKTWDWSFHDLYGTVFLWHTTTMTRVAMHARSPYTHTHSHSTLLLPHLLPDIKDILLTFFIFISGLDMEVPFLIPSTVLKNMSVIVKSRFVGIPINSAFEYRLHQSGVFLCTKVEGKIVYPGAPWPEVISLHL